MNNLFLSKVKNNKKLIIMENEVNVKVLKGGPYLVSGKIKVTLPSGEEKELSGNTAFCRCGQSKNKPFCDGSHHNVEFDK
jgi:hypothetical protein